MDDALNIATQRLSELPFAGVGKLRERKVVTPALLEQLERVTDEPVVKERSIRVDGWLMQPGDTDVATGTAPQYAAVVEVKVNDLEWSFYDLLKVASLVDAGTARAGYLVLCASSSKFQAVGSFAAICTDHEALEIRPLFTRHEKGWLELLRDSSGRPRDIPAAVRLTTITRCSIAAFPGWEIRTLRVVPNGARRLEFLNESWPVGHRRVADIP